MKKKYGFTAEISPREQLSLPPVDIYIPKKKSGKQRPKVGYK